MRAPRGDRVVPRPSRTDDHLGIGAFGQIRNRAQERTAAGGEPGHRDPGRDPVVRAFPYLADRRFGGSDRLVEALAGKGFGEVAQERVVYVMTRPGLSRALIVGLIAAFVGLAVALDVTAESLDTLGTALAATAAATFTAVAIIAAPIVKRHGDRGRCRCPSKS